MKKITTEDFIKKCIKAHHNLYDYSKVIYKNSKSKIEIICSIHGIFFQLPLSHLNHGCGCPKCGILSQTNTRTADLETFVKQAYIIHNDRYDYSLVNYATNKIKITIICSIHGNFNQTPASHLSGAGCPKCGIDKRAAARTKDIFNFIEQASIIHNNKYNYSDAYFNNRYINKIICPNHGLFNQLKNNHLAGHGCMKCAVDARAILKRKSLGEFIEQANKIHNNKYDYSCVHYTRNNDNVIIICPQHGKFDQEALVHLCGSGCPKCNNRISRIEIKWLDGLNIPQEYRQFSIKINNKKIHADGYNPITNTIYEFYGDFYHGNPKVYDQNKINYKIKKTFGELYSITLKREELIRSAGYNLVSIWEYDFKKTLPNRWWLDNK